MLVVACSEDSHQVVQGAVEIADNIDRLSPGRKHRAFHEMRDGLAAKVVEAGLLEPWQGSGVTDAKDIKRWSVQNIGESRHNERSSSRRACHAFEIRSATASEFSARI